MNKKTVGVFIMTLLIATAVLPVANSLKSKTILNLGEVLDQHSEWSDDCIYISDFEWQEFIPTMVIHTRIEVKIVQWYEGSPDLKLTIEKPLGTVLTSKEMPASLIPSGTCDWVSFDFPDINLLPGSNYFIKLTAPPGSEYGWGFSANGLYPNGTSSIWPADWCFRTFCLENNPPNNPTVSYNKANDELVITATDPEGDKVQYGVSWDNDNIVDQWTNLVSSGTQQNIGCNGRTGTVKVIAEDEYGEQSNWVSVTSKNKDNTIALGSRLLGIGFVRINGFTHVIRGFVIFGINDGQFLSMEFIRIKFSEVNVIFAGYFSSLIFFIMYNPA